MNSSTRDSASRIRELTNKTLTDRAQLRGNAAQEELNIAVANLAEARRAHKQSDDEADKQLKTLCVAFDTLIEFIVLNHGELPDKLVEIIAARQEQRIEASMPKADFIKQGVQDGDDVTVKITKYIPGAARQSAQLPALVKEGSWRDSLRPFDSLSEESIKRDLLERLAKASDD